MRRTAWITTLTAAVIRAVTTKSVAGMVWTVPEQFQKIWHTMCWWSWCSCLLTSCSARAQLSCRSSAASCAHPSASDLTKTERRWSNRTPGARHGSSVSSSPIRRSLGKCFSTKETHTVNVCVWFRSFFFFFLGRSIVYLEIDNRLCSQDSESCFPTAESAAGYLGALSAQEMLGKFPYPLKEVRSK